MDRNQWLKTQINSTRGGEAQLCTEFWITDRNTLHSKGRGFTDHAFTCSVTSFKRGQDVNGETGVTLQGWNQTLPQPWARSTSTVINVGSTYAGHDGMKMALYPCGLPSQIPKPQSNHEKKYQKNPNWGAFFKIIDQHASKLSKSSKIRKVWKTVTANRSKKNMSTKGDTVVLDGIVNQKLGIW